MATEVTVRIRDSTLGQAFLVKKEEWDLCLSEIRAILLAQEVDTPSEYRFLTGNGNVVSTTLETTLTFRDVVETEPFAEIKKEDTSLQTAEERVIPQVVIIPVGESLKNPPPQEAENLCPFINKFPCFAGVSGTLPCMRNVFNVHTLIKIGFLLTCLLFLMIFVLTLGVHLLFGIGTIGSFTGHGIFGLGGLPVYTDRHATGAADQEAITALKVKLSEMEVAHRFEIQDLKQKLTELEDLHLSQFKDLEAMRKELAAAKADQSTQTTSSEQYKTQMDQLSDRLSKVEDAMVEGKQPQQPQYTDFTKDAETVGVYSMAQETEEEGTEELKGETANEEEVAKEKKSKEDKKKKKDKGKNKDKKNKKRN